MANITQMDIINLQKNNMLEYYLSIMYDRAIPDIRDGFKPVQRRILWAMYNDTKAFYSKPFKKAARCVGNVLIYHPHGNASAYDAMVRMGQNFIQNIPFIDPHGNIGNIDGSPAAAERYLELRLSKFSEKEILDSLEKKPVTFIPNFDNLDIEPEILPSPTCLLLISGSLGIAGGYSSCIPPHSLKDVGNEIIKIIDNPNITVNEIANDLIPDFPTGGVLCNKNDIVNAYITGRGNVKLRARTEIVHNKNGTSEIVIREIPYLCTIGPRITSTSTNAKGGLLNSIVDKIKDGTIEGVKDIHDLSKKDIEIRIFIKSGFDPEVILNQLYKFTLMEITQKIILVCKNKNNFKEYNIKEIFDIWINFRIDCIRRMIITDIQKYQERDHILDGLIIAVSNIDEVIKIIKKSKDIPTAREKLEAKFNLTELQSKAITDMRLGKLTGLEINKLKEEKKEISEKLKQLEDDLFIDNIKKRIKEEQKYLIETYGKGKRKTSIEEIDTDIDVEDIIANEPALIAITNDNSIKRIRPEFKVQKRNTQGISIGDDKITQLFSAETKDHLLCFTNKGRVYDIKVYEIPELASIKNRAKKVENYIKLNDDEKVTNILCISNNQFNDNESYLVFVTKKSLIKKTKLEYFANINSSGLIAIMLNSDDELADVKYIDTSKKMQDLIIITKNGQAARYAHTEIPDLKRDTRGALSFNLDDGDEVVNFDIIESFKQELFVSTINGLAKTIKVTDKVTKKDPNTKEDVEIDDGFPRLKRSSNIKGRKCITLNDGDSVSSVLVKSETDNHIFAITVNKINAVDITDFTPSKRAAKGKLLISLKDNDKLIKVVLG